METSQHSHTPADRLYDVLYKEGRTPTRVSLVDIESSPHLFIIPATAYVELESFVARINADIPEGSEVKLVYEMPQVEQPVEEEKATDTETPATPETTDAPVATEPAVTPEGTVPATDAPVDPQPTEQGSDTPVPATTETPDETQPAEQPVDNTPATPDVDHQGE